jgi:hypothetical protein
MNENELRRALGEAIRDDDQARERSWRVVRAAYGEHVPRRRRRPWAALAVTTGMLAVGAVAATAAGAPDTDVGRWVRGVLGVSAEPARPALDRVPGGGRLLVSAGDSVWVVSSDGSKRRLGRYAGASWSPQGLFAVAWKAGRLTAVDPRGGVRWSLDRRERIAAARWGAVDGFRVAYLSGSTLRIVNGDGTGDRRYASADPAAAPAWRPDNTHVLAYVNRRGAVEVAAVDSRQRLWRSAALRDPAALLWAPGGGRLLAVTARRLVLFDGSGRVVASRPLPPGFVAEQAAWAPRGGRIALLRRNLAAGRSEVVLLDVSQDLRERVLLAGPGRFAAVAWSPSGRRLLLSWPDVDQWLFLDPRSRGRSIAVAGIAGQFAPGSDQPRFPHLTEWCCTSPARRGP